MYVAPGIHKELPKRIVKHEGKHSSSIIICASHSLADVTQKGITQGRK